MSLKNLALLALATGFATVSNAQTSGTGTTTRYWDCCKPSCAWSGKALVSSPVQQCDKNNNPLAGGDSQQSGCNGGGAYNCADQTPQVNPENPLQAFGFAAANVGGESASCCSCYELTFTSTSLQSAGKSMIVQVTNSGSDLVPNQFDIAFPGGGVGIFNACTNQYGNFPLGAQYGGISDASLCDQYPAALKAGCKFRFGWFEGADNPTVSYKKVTCPAALTDKTGCIRQGEVPTGSSGSSATVAPLPVPSSSSTSVARAPQSSSSSAVVPASSAASSSTYVASTVASTVATSAATTVATTTAVTSSAAASTYSSAAASSSTTTTTSDSGISSYSTLPQQPSGSANSSSVATFVTTTSAMLPTSTESESDCGCPVATVTVFDL